MNESGGIVSADLTSVYECCLFSMLQLEFSSYPVFSWQHSYFVFTSLKRSCIFVVILKSKVREKYWISLLGLEKSSKFNTLSHHTVFCEIRLPVFRRGKFGSSLV